MGILSKLASKASKELGSKIRKLNKEIADAKKVKGIKGAKEEFKLKDKVKPLKKEMEKKIVKNLQSKLDKIKAEKQKKKVSKPKPSTTKTLEKVKKKQVNLNTNQKTGLKTNKIVKGDETKDALKTSPLTQKELKEKGMVSGASELRLSMASIKGAAKGLAEQLKKKKKLYDDLSSTDKRGEKGQLLQNAMDGIKKKLKGQVPIKTLRNAGLMNKGGLATPTANQTGLQKLPTAVRNKMGYMYGGGMAKKKKVTNMDYRKGGLVIMIGTGKPMKNKKGK